MSTLENLENLNVSEACFDNIISIIEKVLNEKYENGYEDAPKGHRHKVGDEVQVHFGAGLDGGKSGKISSLYKNHNGHTWAKGEGADGAFDVPTSYLRTKKKVGTEECLESIIRIVEDLLQDTKSIRRNAVLNMKKNIKKAKNAESGSDEYLDARASALRNKLKADFAQNKVNRLLGDR